MSNTFKILANSLFGVTMTRCEKFKNFKIITNEQQVDKNVKNLILIVETLLMKI